MQQLKPNDIIMFVLELIMLFAFGCYGYTTGTSSAAKIGLIICLVGAAGFAWGYWAAPKSKHRLSMPALAVFRLILFLLAAAALYACGFQWVALAFAVIAFINQVLSYYVQPK